VDEIGMSNVTQILLQIDAGEPQAAEQLLPLVYGELRKLAAAQLAREKPGQTLEATALVHEAWLRLVGGGQRSEVRSQRSDEQKATSDLRSLTSGHWDSRGHFFAAAAEAMRRILVEAARRRQSQKRGGDLVRQDVDELDVPLKQPPEEVLAVHEALDRLAVIDGRAAELVKLRYFGGFTLKEAAEVLGIAPRTADDVWAYARAWLAAEIESQS
jgi:RNA polymerase sigma factor (TIGR02999 family)